ncbi:hypothetical protein V2G26_005334 [Clonostachys chloroleuca]
MSSIHELHSSEAGFKARLLLPQRDPDTKVDWFNEPGILGPPIGRWVLKLKVELTYESRYHLGHLKEGYMATNTRPGAKAEGHPSSLHPLQSLSISPFLGFNPPIWPE